MNVLFIGLGSIAKKHIAALKELYPDVKFFALRSSLNFEQVESVVSFSDLKEFKESPDFIIISNPTFKHLDAIKLATVFNKPLFIEKPLFHKLDGIDELIKDISAKKIPTYIGCNLRFHSCLNFVKDHIAKQKPRINEINAYCGSYLPEWRGGADHNKSYSSHKEQGGGVHLDLIHELDYLYWMFSKPISVQRELTASSSLQIDAVDHAAYILKYDGFSAGVVLNYFRRDAKRTLEIVFDNDTWLVDVFSNTIMSLVNKKTIFTSDEKILETYKKQMKYFIDAIKTNSPLMNDIKEANEVLKICIQ